MESYELNACVERLNTLKKDVQRSQKKGLPFIMASVVIWGLIFIARLVSKDLRTANLATFICCCLLIPMAFLFSKSLKAEIFRKTGNPINGLIILSTLNQLLYLLITHWKPDTWEGISGSWERSCGWSGTSRQARKDKTDHAGTSVPAFFVTKSLFCDKVA